MRVDARRLRRLLDEFYGSKEGESAPLRILIPTGSYVPEFKVTPNAERAPPRVVPPWLTPARLKIGAAFAACLSIILIAAAVYEPYTSTNASERTGEAERLALFDRSGSVLQAQNLCRRARGMLFPIAELPQQETATDLFRQAMELAPEYACGYSGAAHSVATQALLAPMGERRNALANEAQDLSARAQVLAPTDGWAMSGVAWAAFAAGNHTRALEVARLSEQLSPNDGNVLDFYGLIALLTGNYAEARQVVDPARDRDTIGLGHAHRNIYGVASFHDGDYQAAIQSWEDAIRLGEPVSAFTLVFLTAAHQANGDLRTAQQNARKLEDGWPDFPVVVALESFYPKQEDARLIVDLLEAAGWTPPAQERQTSADSN